MQNQLRSRYNYDNDGEQLHFHSTTKCNHQVCLYPHEYVGYIYFRQPCGVVRLLHICQGVKSRGFHACEVLSTSTLSVSNYHYASFFQGPEFLIPNFYLLRSNYIISFTLLALFLCCLFIVFLPHHAYTTGCTSRRSGGGNDLVKFPFNLSITRPRHTVGNAIGYRRL